jgi:predicted aspartyl protease
VIANGVAGQISGVRMTVVQMATGEAPPAPRAAAVMDMGAVAAAVDRPVQVILGREVFDAAVVDIDFARRQLRLIPRESFQPPDATPLPLKPSGTLHSIPITVQGHAMQAVVDLGHAGALMLDREAADSLGLTPSAHTSTEIGVGADGPREHLVGSLGEVEVAGLRLRDVPTTFVDQLSSRAPANVGLQILSRFEVILDFRGERAWLLPNRSATTAGFRKNRTGLAANRTGDHLTVMHVAPGSPAAAAGGKPGEAISAVDGQPIGPDYGSSPAWGFSYRPAGTTVRLTMADGTRRSLKLADYY